MNAELPETFRVLFRVIDILEALGADYHVGGSYASSVHGVPRQTQDIDLVLGMTHDKVEEFASRLEGEFYLDRDNLHHAVSNKSSANLIHLDTAVKIDLFIHGDTPYDKEEFARARPELLWFDPERRVKIKTAEDTILRKLQWYRIGGEVSDRQWNDVLGILKTQRENLELDYLRSWARVLNIEDLFELVWNQSGE